MNIKAGTFENFAVVCQQTSSTVSEADVTVNVYDGATISGMFAGMQTGNMMFLGKATLNIYGGDFSGITLADLNNLAASNGATLTINHDPNNAASAAAFKALKDASVGDSDCVYGEIKVEATTTETPTTTAAPTTTEAPTTTAAPTTTVAPTTEPTVDTTVAPEVPEDTPATGDASVMVVFAAAAVLCVAAVVIIKKREN